MSENKPNFSKCMDVFNTQLQYCNSLNDASRNDCFKLAENIKQLCDDLNKPMTMTIFYLTEPGKKKSQCSGCDCGQNSWPIF